MVAIADEIFTAGIYPLDQAARLARLSTRSFRRWLDGTEESEPALRRFMPRNDVEVVSFIDLVQALAIRAMRKSKKLSLQKVRETIKEAERLGVKFPFAQKHQTYLFDDDVVLELPDGNLIGATGKYKRQHLIRPVVELYLYDLHFNEATGLADKYTPLSDGERRIVVDPRVKFGAPTVQPCGYTVSSLIAAVESEGSIAAAAEAFGVDEADVKLALRYDDLLAETVA